MSGRCPGMDSASSWEDFCRERALINEEPCEECGRPQSESHAHWITRDDTSRFELGLFFFCAANIRAPSTFYTHLTANNSDELVLLTSVGYICLKLQLAGSVWARFQIETIHIHKLFLKIYELRGNKWAESRTQEGEVRTRWETHYWSWSLYMFIARHVL